MPPDVAREAVDVLLNSQASRDLPMPAMPMTETSCARSLVGGGVEELLDEPELAVAADERRLEARRAPCARRAPATTRSARQSCAGLGLALQLVLAGVLVGDRRLGGAPRRLADEHGAGLGRATGSARRC